MTLRAAECIACMEGTCTHLPSGGSETPAVENTILNSTLICPVKICSATDLQEIRSICCLEVQNRQVTEEYREQSSLLVTCLLLVSLLACLNLPP